MARTPAAALAIKLIALAASLRRESLNRRLLALAIPLAREAGAEVEVLDFREFIYPAFDADMMAEEGVPPAVNRLADLIRGSDGLLLASPEYNYSMPGNLKNTIDWVSRIRPFPVQGRWAFLMSASNGRVGGNRGLWALRVPLESMGMMVYPEMFSLAAAASAFAPDGSLMDAEPRERLARLVDGFVRQVSRARA